MNRIILILGIFILGALLFACTTKGIPSREPAGPEALPKPPVTDKGTWAVKWEESLREAKKEGKVNIYSFLAANMRQELGKGFNKRFGINVEWTTGSGTELVQKILTEKRAGINLADITLTGSTDIIARLKTAGGLDPLDKELLLPEVTDTSRWLNNELPWVDKEKLLIAPAQTPASNILINTDRVSPQEITSYRDLLNPKWKGKMTILNPTRPGASGKWMSVVGMEIMGVDYIKELAKQELVFVENKRLPVEWVAKGKYDIAIAPSAEIVSDFVDSGAKNLQLLSPKEGGYQTAGSSPITLIKGRPHPNSSRIFLNWYLNQEGQQLFALYDWREGMRLDIDVSKVPEIKKRQPGIKYFNSEKEEFLLREHDFLETVAEIFKPYTK